MKYNELKKCENNFINEFLNFIIKEYKVSGATIFKIDEKKRKIIFKSVAGTNAENLIENKMVYGEGIVGHCVKNSTSLFTNDVKNDIRFNKSYDRKIGFETKKLLVSPIIIENKIIAAVELINKIDADFNDSDKEQLEILVKEFSRKIEKKLYDL